MRLRLRIAPDRRCVCTRFVLALICVGASFLSAANPHGAAPLFLHGLLNPIGPRFVSCHRRTPAKRPRLGSATLTLSAASKAAPNSALSPGLWFCCAPLPPCVPKSAVCPVCSG